MSRVYPLPEAVTSDRYEVDEGYGSVDNAARQMKVPLDDSPLGQRVRVHEVAHAQLSPERPEAPDGIDPYAVQVAEDMRMNLHATRRGLSEILMGGGLDESELGKIVTRYVDNRTLALGLALATYGTGDHEPTLRLLERRAGPTDTGEPLADEARRFAKTAYEALDAIEEPSFEDTLRLARFLMEWADDPTPAPPPDEGEGEGEGGSVAVVGTDAAGEGEGDPKGKGAGRPAGDSDRGEGTDADGSASKPGTEQPADAKPADGDDSGDDGEDRPATDHIAGGGATEDRSPMTGVPAKLPPLRKTGAPKPTSRPIPLHSDGLESATTTSLRAIHEASEGDEPWLETDPGGVPDDLMEGVRDAARSMVRRTYGSGTPSGKMSIAKPPRTKRLPQRLIGRRRRTSPEGRVPRHMARYATDRSVFEERGKKPGGGTVLIDTSGSMRLTAGQVRQIMEMAPAATIAAYSGYGNEGTLRILAKDGMRVRDDVLEGEVRGYGNGNIVDLPAVEWLAKQPQPRLWVCDGVVTGRGDTPGLELAEACAALSIRRNILRLRHVKEVIQWFRNAKEAKEARRGSRQARARRVSAAKRKKRS